MTARYIIIFFLIISFSDVFGQEEKDSDTTHSDWKKIFIYHDFTITKNKKNIPLTVLQRINIDSVSEIANPRGKWNSSCIGKKNVPNRKLNWAAYVADSTAWVISVTSGGYSVDTTYYLLVIDGNDEEIETIRNPGWKTENFKSFKKKYLTDTIIKGSLF